MRDVTLSIINTCFIWHDKALISFGQLNATERLLLIVWGKKPIGQIGRIVHYNDQTYKQEAQLLYRNPTTQTQTQQRSILFAVAYY